VQGGPFAAFPANIKMASPVAAGYLRPDEEELSELFSRLCTRFPTFPPERVASILRESDGHAGQAAATLRDLSGTAMRAVDPDDAEHVRTLLSSPIMFKHACKEQFRKFDVNGDGVLQWQEILALVNALYSSFGLEVPREGSLKAFFDSTDDNHDGVLSEKEFNKFFEMFLRYAFFDVVQHERQNPTRFGEGDEVEEASAPQARTPTPARAPPAKLATPSLQSASGSRRKKASAEERDHHVAREESRAQLSTRTAAGTTYRCIAGHGVTYRGSPEYDNRMDSMCRRGDAVQVLEHWIKTPKGWLPMVDARGKVLFEAVPPDGSCASGHGNSEAEVPEGRKPRSRSTPSTSKRSSKGVGEASVVSPMAGCVLLPEEEDWGPRLERLRERFPTASTEQVLLALRTHGGHAGQAATTLRDLITGG